ncbi:helix-turn-helix domain-containing protein [Haliangium sp.]|uniref:helix-turn-helix domain-containing protein n=1 Tax=Haliangium sp. TaxID=2663208 RepID=UPI003D1368E2
MKKERAQELANTIGVHIGNARRALGITQEEASERIGITVEYYARIERRQALPSLQVFAQIAAVLNVSSDILLGFDPTSPDPARAAPPWFELPEPDESKELQRLIRRLRRLPPEVVTAVDAVAKQLERFIDKQRQKRRR